jgi:GxxExxY protein
MEKERAEYIVSHIFKAALEVHKSLGPGLLESVYEHCLVKELQSRGFVLERQVKVPLFYKEADTGKDFFLDILVEKEIIIEVKSCDEGLRPVHHAQLLSYLKLSGKKIGILINFNVVLLKQGFKRIVNGY